MRALVIVAMLGAIAHADDGDAPKPRPFHGSIAAGSALVFGSANRGAAAAAIDIVPGGALGTWGVTLAVRDVGYSPFAHHGMATIGIVREAAAARPLLVINLHGDVGVAWGDKTLPVIGGGIKTDLAFVGPLGIALDTTIHLEVDGVDGTHLVLGFGLMAALIR
jgi:hypothetical protein